MTQSKIRFVCPNCQGKEQNGKYTDRQISEAVFKGVKKCTTFDDEQDYIDFCLDIITEITGEIKQDEQ